MPPAAAPSPLLLRLLSALGAGGLFAGGFAAGRMTVEGAPAPAAAAPAASTGYVRLRPGTHPPPPPQLNACYAAGSRTAPLPCLDVADPQLPMLIGQCKHPAANINEGPATAQYAGSPAVICCYRADMPTCSGRPLLLAGAPRLAAIVSARAWSAVGRAWPRRQGVLRLRVPSQVPHCPAPVHSLVCRCRSRSQRRSLGCTDKS